MSLDFYARIKQYTDGDKNIAINILAGNFTDNQIIALKNLKNEQVVHFVAEDARLKFDEEVDVETGDSKFRYFRNGSGFWEKEEVEQTALDLDDQPNYEKQSREITADIVDDFILSQKIEYKDFDIVKVLAGISEGYTHEDLAKERKISITELVSEINKARDYFAPFAATWLAEKEEDKK